MTSFGAATRESPDGRECEFYKLAASGQPRDRRRGERQLSGSFINWRSRPRADLRDRQQSGTLMEDTVYLPGLVPARSCVSQRVA